MSQAFESRLYVSPKPIRSIYHKKKKRIEKNEGDEKYQVESNFLPGKTKLNQFVLIIIEKKKKEKKVPLSLHQLCTKRINFDFSLETQPK